MKNKINKSIAAAAIVGLAITCFAFKGDQNNSLSKTERANGWQLLFDGHSTAGWHLYNGTAQFTVWKAKDGALVCDPLDKSGAGDLVTDQEFKNFDLKFDWKLPKVGIAAYLSTFWNDSIFLPHGRPGRNINYWMMPILISQNRNRAPDAFMASHLKKPR